jgi:hypothetical protein
MAWVMHFRCGGQMMPFRKDTGCYTCGKPILHRVVFIPDKAPDGCRAWKRAVTRMVTG